MIIELVDLLIEKYEAPEFLQLGYIKDLNKRLKHLSMLSFHSNGHERLIPVFISF
jgi:hypothetical protein